MGSTQSKQNQGNADTLNWNDLNTDNFSSTNLVNPLSNDAKQLVRNLNISNASEAISDVDFNDIFKNKYNKEIDQSDDLTNSSTFITSEMYNNLVNSLTSNTSEFKQMGGGNKQSKKQVKVAKTQSEPARKQVKVAKTQSKPVRKQVKVAKTQSKPAEKQSKPVKKQSRKAKLSGHEEDRHYRDTSEDKSDTSDKKRDGTSDEERDGTSDEERDGTSNEKRDGTSEDSDTPQEIRGRNASRGRDASRDGYDYVSSSAHTGGSSELNNSSVSNENSNYTSLSVNTDDINMVTNDYDDYE